LWDQVRVQGGAYGAFSLFDRFSGTLSFVSYRDPNLLKTLERFDETVTFLRTTDLTDRELTKSIIGTIGEIDKHFLPDAKGYVSMMRYLTNDSEEKRQLLRSEVLTTSVKDFRDFANILETVKETGLVKVVGSAHAIEAAAGDRKDWLQIFRVL
jgi:hypothetical protein